MGRIEFSVAAGAARPCWPARCHARVLFCPGERRDVQRTARWLFGRKLKLWEYAGLAGAPDAAEVELGILDGELYIRMHDPLTNSYRAVDIVRRGCSALVLVIDAFHILSKGMQRRGLGLCIFSRQLHQAKYLGVKRIETTAGRTGDENGYYTWPRFGFDGPLSAEIKRVLPLRLRYAQSVLDLMGRDEGRLWWKQHGTTIDVAFDVDDSSRCWKTFQRYFREKLKSPLHAGVP